jgi:hypothetical protein
MARVIAARLRSHPELVQVVEANLERWMRGCDARVRPVMEEWKHLLDGPLENVLNVLESDTEEAARLRQSSPFAGEAFITRKERNEILLTTR